MQTNRDRFHLIGADRIALTLIAIMLIATALFWAMIVVAAGIGGANHVLASTGLSWLEDGLIGIALLWIALRGIDYARGGATRALLSRPAQTGEARGVLSGGKDLAAHHS